jgi:hypothetical protein
MYNPGGNRFMLMHRWNKDDVDYTRLYIANSNDGKDIIGFPDVKFYSHAFWLDNETLTIWSNDFGSLENKTIQNIENLKQNIFIKTFIKPIYRLLRPVIPKNVKNAIQVTGQLYNLTDFTNKYKELDEVLAQKALYGHFCWFKDKLHLLIDTYQDKNNYRWLYVYNTSTKDLKALAKFHSYYNDSGYRCDLHPRLSVDERFITVDVAMDNKRKQIILEVEK